MTTTDSNSLPALLDTLRLSLRDIAEAADVAKNTADLWLQGVYQPEPEARARLLEFVERHVTTLRTLAKAVKEEGKRRDKQPRRGRRRNRSLRGTYRKEG